MKVIQFEKPNTRQLNLEEDIKDLAETAKAINKAWSMTGHSGNIALQLLMFADNVVRDIVRETCQ